MAKQSRAQKDTVERVMHEFKEGELKQNGGARVKNPKQAIAIALREAGSSNQESPAENRKHLKATKAKERRGETGRNAAEGRTGSSRGGDPEKTRAELYAMAKKQNLPGRSTMKKDELARALHV